MVPRTRAVFLSALLGPVLSISPLAGPALAGEGASVFLRGDPNGDGKVDLADTLSILGHLFIGAPSLCLDAMDENDDGAVDLADALRGLFYLFAGGPPPEEPFSGGIPGLDPTPDGPGGELGCRMFPVAVGPWPMFRHDPKHTGRTRYSGPASPTVAWTFHMNDGIVSSPAIAADGTIYAGAGWQYLAKDRHLHALRPDGTLKWSLEGDDGFFSSPAIGPDGTIYIGCLHGNLHAIEDRGSEGRLKWETYLGAFFSLSSPTVGSDGTIYVGSPSFQFYAIDPDGTVRWSWWTESCVISSPAVDDGGTIYIGSKDHRLYAFDPFGQGVKWSFAAGEFYDGHLADSSPAIGPDGTIYFGTDPYGASGQDPVTVRDNFWALRPDGTLKWTFETEDGVESSPAIGPDGTIYFGSYDHHLYAVTDAGTEGRLRWKFETGGVIEGGPAVDGAGTIYAGSRDSRLYALRPDGSVKWTFLAGGGFASSPVIDGVGRLYAGSLDGTLYVLGTGGADVGVESIDVLPRLEPSSTIIPAATVASFRARSESFDVLCEIEAGGIVVYRDTVSVQAPGGTSRAVRFAPWTVGPDPGIASRVTVTTLLSDEDPENDSASLQTGT
jgi:outer membrane protein assembly factor BamB